MKHKKGKKKKSITLNIIIGLIAVWLFAGLFLFFGNNQKPASPSSPMGIFVSSENPKQGDTVFIKVKSDAKNVSGNFDSEKLVFYKKANSSDWISFLGIDADQKPGDYKIDINEAGGQVATKDIKVSLASFSAEAPAPVATGISNTQAVDNIRKNDNPAINKVLSNFTLAPYFSQPFSYPLNSMKKSGFSFGQFIGFGSSALQHLGVDLRASEKTNIYSVNDGKVVATLNLENYGKTVIVDHGLDIFSMYLHLEKFDVSDGQMVKKGQVIGLSGDTGYTTAPHLHFSMRVDGTRVDPVSFIETSQQIGGSSIAASISNAVYNFFK